MTQNLADLVSSVGKAERRLHEMTPRTTAWLEAQRDAVRARAKYWDARCEEWDRNHPKAADPGRPLRVT